MNRILISLTFLIFAISSCTKSNEVFVTDEGAVKGYDVVSYFRKSGPIKGKNKYSYEWNNATWYFSDEANLNTFKTNPEKYAPQYGGYCAYGTADGHKAPTDPEAWAIVDGKLYLNYNKDVQTEWKQNQKDFIEKANKNWPEVKTQSF